MIRFPSASPWLLAAALVVGAAPLTAQAHKELGRMWTFENAPMDYFTETYGFQVPRFWH
jgi:hypothetical protein